MQNNIFTVTQLNYSVRNLLEMELGQIWLTGEISNFSSPVSGHWYLTLKDEQAQVRCAMFRMKNQRVAFRPQNGMQVLVRASVSLYEPRGDYQVIIESMQPAGDGLLQQQFEQLKMRLAAEGLFAQEHKKPLPGFVKRVGIITSSSGAALQDILQILARRDPSLEVVIYPTLVQSNEAAQEIVATIELANRRRECDVLIVGRGGGSLEDLWCFNEEAVARAIFRSELPIISAVGHETDVTIADFVADLRAPTPSAAAELVSRDRTELVRRLQHQFDKISLSFNRLWATKRQQFAQFAHRLKLQHPAKQLLLQRQTFAQLERRLERSLIAQTLLQKQQLNQLSQRLNAQHPERQLQRHQQQFEQLAKRAALSIEQIWLRKQQKWQHLAKRAANNPLPHRLVQQRQQLGTLEQRLNYAVEKTWQSRREQFQQLCTQLEGLSPLKILARGYSITQNQAGDALLSAKNVREGEIITTRLSRGLVHSQVLAVFEE